MKELLALLIMISDSLLTFMHLQIELYYNSVVIVIYDNANQVQEYQSFRWDNDFDKNIVLRRAISWLLDQAYLTITKGDNHSESHSQNILSKPS
jgi:hypothetical protein